MRLINFLWQKKIVPFFLLFPITLSFSKEPIEEILINKITESLSVDNGKLKKIQMPNIIDQTNDISIAITQKNDNKVYCDQKKTRLVNIFFGSFPEICECPSCGNNVHIQIGSKNKHQSVYSVNASYGDCSHTKEYFSNSSAADKKKGECSTDNYVFNIKHSNDKIVIYFQQKIIAAMNYKDFKLEEIRFSAINVPFHADVTYGFPFPNLESELRIIEFDSPIFKNIIKIP